jgi:hypothetical protein
MIITAFIVLVIILLFSNITLYYFNKLYPPCESVEDYLLSARNIIDSDINNFNHYPNKFKIIDNAPIIYYDEITLDDKVSLDDLKIYDKINEKLNSKSSTTSTNSKVEFDSSLEDIQVRPKEKVVKSNPEMLSAFQ